VGKLLEPEDFGGERGWVRADEVEMAPEHWGRPLRRGDVIFIGKNFDPDQFGELPRDQDRRTLGIGDDGPEGFIALA
jgi:hypothetical protein